MRGREIRLPARADERCGGREADEEVEVVRETLLVKVARAGDFRREDALEAVPRQVVKKRVVEDAGGVNDSFHRQRRVEKIRRGCDVSAHDANVGVFESVELRRGAADEDQVPRAVLHHPTRDVAAEGTGGAGDRVRGVVAKTDGRIAHFRWNEAW